MLYFHQNDEHLYNQTQKTFFLKKVFDGAL